MSFKPSDVTFKCDAISRIEACVADIWIWMNDKDIERHTAHTTGS